MFLIIGIEDGRKDFEYGQMVICSSCGRYGRMNVYMTFTAFLLFFIPIFRWNRQYYVQMSCCGKTYILNPEIGKRIARGEEVEIRPEDLTPVGGWQTGGYSGNGRNSANPGNAWNNGNTGLKKKCFFCGFETEEDFDYCPKCGRKF